MHSFQPAQYEDEYDVVRIASAAGLNTRDAPLSLQPDEFTSLQNAVLQSRGLLKREGVAAFGSAMTGTTVSGIGFHENDTGITPLAMVNRTLFKYVSNAWAAGDKTDYTANLPTTILQFAGKSGTAVDTGTSTSGSTTYQIEDGTKSWTRGAYAGKCVVIEGEVKYIADNTGTVLILGEKLNSNVDSAYQSKAYAIHNLAPHAFILNGTDAVTKYDLTTSTKIDGTHVTSGIALPIAAIGAVHQGRMWLATGDGNENDRVFLSDAGVGENITTDTNININLQFFNDGDEIANIGSMPMSQSSACVVAKTSSVHVVEGETVLNYTTRPVIAREGALARRSFAVGKGTAFMLGKDGKVISLSDLGQGPLQDPLPISRLIKDDISAHSLAEQTAAIGIIHDNKYFLQVGDSMWYYDIEESIAQNRHIWVDLSYGLTEMHFGAMASINETLYAGKSTSGQVYTLFSGNADIAEDIEMVIESGEITMPSHAHFWVDRVEFKAGAQASTVLSFQFLTDGGSYGSVQSATLNETDGRYVFPIHKRVRSFRYKISERGTNAPARILYPIDIFVRRSDVGEDGTKG